MISPGNLQVSSRTTDTINELSYPTDVSRRSAFLGASDRVALILLQLFLIRQGPELKVSEGLSRAIWTEWLQERSDRQIQKLPWPPALASPQPMGQFTSDTDACDYQVGCLLLQKQSKDLLRPVGYWSRTLRPRRDAFRHSTQGMSVRDMVRTSDKKYWSPGVRTASEFQKENRTPGRMVTEACQARLWSNPWFGSIPQGTKRFVATT